MEKYIKLYQQLFQWQIIMKMSHEEAIKALIKNNNIENKIKIVESVKDTNIFSLK